MPLAEHVFFLAQLQTFGYVAVYYGVLALRFRAGRVTPAMLAIPRQRPFLFAGMGLLEAAASLLGFATAARLPGVLLPLLGQSILLWQVALGCIVLKKKLGAAQVSSRTAGEAAPAACDASANSRH